MSYNLEGKVANQYPSYRFDGDNLCETCKKLIPAPYPTILDVDKKSYLVNSYLGTQYYIYEAKSGNAVVYCSKWCLKKHNHRFTNIKSKEIKYG